MSVKYFECVFTENGEQMLVSASFHAMLLTLLHGNPMQPDDKLGEVVKAMKVMCSHGMPPEQARQRIFEIFFDKEEENSETDAKLEHIFKTVTHLHQINGDYSDESCSLKTSGRQPSSRDPGKGPPDPANSTNQPKETSVGKETPAATTETTLPVDSPEHNAEPSICEEIPVVANEISLPVDFAERNAATTTAASVQQLKGDTWVGAKENLVTTNFSSAVDAKAQEALSASEPAAIEADKKEHFSDEKEDTAGKDEQNVPKAPSPKLSAPVPAQDAKNERKETDAPRTQPPTNVAGKTDPEPAVLRPSTPRPPVIKSRPTSSAERSKSPIPVCTVRVPSPSGKSRPSTSTGETKRAVKSRGKPEVKPTSKTKQKIEAEKPAPAPKKVVNPRSPKAAQTPPISSSQKSPPKETIMAGGEGIMASNRDVCLEQATTSSAGARGNGNSQRRREIHDSLQKTVFNSRRFNLNHDKRWSRSNLMFIAGGLSVAAVGVLVYFRSKS